MTQDSGYTAEDLIISHIEETNTIIGNIREFQELILNVTDPALKLIYEDDIKKEGEEFDKICQNLKFLLRNYMKDCKQDGTPININFYRVYKELEKLGDE